MKKRGYLGSIRAVVDRLWGTREGKEARMESAALLWISGLAKTPVWEER